MKEPKCTICGGKHYKTFCSKAPKKPIKKSLIKKSNRVKKQQTKSKGHSRSWYVKRLDQVFSQYIRQRDAKDGITTCVTCGDKKPYQQHQCGHYYSRSHYNTRWDETNCHVQCVGCNVFKHGAYTEYALFMINKYGIDYVKELDAKSKQLVKIPTQQIKDMIIYYREQVKTLEKTKN